MSEPTLPQGAGYGVGALHSSQSDPPSLTQCVSCEQSWVRIPPPHRSYRLLNVCGRRHRSFLQRVYGWVDRSPIALHWLLPEKRRRIQQCVQERQTWPHRRRYRLRVDMGRYSGSLISPTFVPFIPTPDTNLIWPLLVLHHSCNQVLWLINTAYPVRGGTALARRFKFCYSPRSGRCSQIQQSVEANSNLR